MCGSHRPPWRHPQLRGHRAPGRPGRHSAAREWGEVTSWGGATTRGPPCLPWSPGRSGAGAGRPAGLRLHPGCRPCPEQEAGLGLRGRGLHRGPWGASPGSRRAPGTPVLPLPTQSSPCSQAGPAQPSTQAQWPETGSQVPPFRHRQACWQFSPYRPEGQAGSRGSNVRHLPARSQGPRPPSPGGPAHSPTSDQGCGPARHCP